MKKGFTLIELLAVIVVLAIIALIATPIVLNIINDAKSSSNERSLELYKQSAENAVARYRLKTGQSLLGSYSTTKDGKKLYLKSDITKTPILNLSIDYSGSKVTCDKVNISSDGKISYNNCKVNDVLITSTVLVSESFSQDSWITISKIVKEGKASEIYKIGDTKEVDIGTYGKHNVRIANMSTPSDCSTVGYSQTACGFVLEFEDIIKIYNMNSTSTNKGGYPAASRMYTFLLNDIYNALPTDLKNVIINTTVVSSHGSQDTENFISTDKLYLLSNKEIWNGNTDADTSANTTKQLDYYKEIGITASSFAGAIKKYNGVERAWWLRSANSTDYYAFHHVSTNGARSAYSANGSGITIGASPAFRIG